VQTVPYSHRTIIADIIVVGLALQPTTFTLLETTAYFMCGSPHQLCIVAHYIQVVMWRSICEVMPLQEPCLDGEVPKKLQYFEVKYVRRKYV